MVCSNIILQLVSTNQLHLEAQIESKMFKIEDSMLQKLKLLIPRKDFRDNLSFKI